MKNKKGFTLIELLAVIVILGIIVTLAVTGTNPILKTFSNSYYKTIEGNVKIAAKDYFTDNITGEPNMLVTIDDLVNLGYIDNKVVNKKGNKCSGNVLATKEQYNKDYKYDVCLDCDEYISTANCNGSEILEVPDDYYYQWNEKNLEGPLIINAIKKDFQNNGTEILPKSIYIIIKTENTEELLQKYDTSDANDTDIIKLRGDILTYLNNTKGEDTSIYDYLEDHNVIIRLDYDENNTSNKFDKTDKTTDITPISDFEENIPSPKVTLKNTKDLNTYLAEYNKDSDMKDYPYQSGSIKATFEPDSYTLSPGEDMYMCYDGDDIENAIPIECPNGKKFTATDTSINEIHYVSMRTKYGESIKVPYQIKIDNIKPEVIFSFEGDEGFNGWYISDVNANIFINNIGPSGIDPSSIKYCIGFNGSTHVNCTPTEKLSINNKDNVVTKIINQVSILDKNKEQNNGRDICIEVRSNSGITSTYCSNNKIKIDTITPNSPEIALKYNTDKTTGTLTATAWNDNTISGFDSYKYLYFLYNKSLLGNISKVSNITLYTTLITFSKNYIGNNFLNPYISSGDNSKHFYLIVYSKAGNHYYNYTDIETVILEPESEEEILTAPNDPIITGQDENKYGVGIGNIINTDLNISVSGEGKLYYCDSSDNCNPTTSYNDKKTYLTDGKHYFNAKACNTKNTSICSNIVKYNAVIDKTPPTSPTINGISKEQVTSNVKFTLTAGTDYGSGVAKTEWSKDNKAWYTYSGQTTLLTNTGTQKVYARTCDKVGNCSAIVNKTAILNKDGVNISAPVDYGSTGTEYYDVFSITNKNASLTGITVSKYEWAYWNAAQTNDTQNKLSSSVSTKCGSTPPTGYIKTTSTSRITIWLKYSKQYYCFAVRPYRQTEIPGVNRWTIQYKHAITGNNVSGKKYNGN